MLAYTHQAIDIGILLLSPAIEVSVNQSLLRYVERSFELGKKSFPVVAGLGLSCFSVPDSPCCAFWGWGGGRGVLTQDLLRLQLESARIDSEFNSYAPDHMLPLTGTAIPIGADGSDCLA